MKTFQKNFRVSMTWLHTWCGLLLGWLLYAIFLTGTATYFKSEITQWMQPELRPAGVSSQQALDLATVTLRELAPDATALYIVLPDARNPGLVLNWETPAGRGEKTVDALTAQVKARDSRGGEFFYRFHFQLQLPYPWGRFLACLAAVFMLVALITGIIAHRRFFKDFFTFRPGKGGGRSWLDFHNLAGVIALPFYLMISYSALILFMAMFMPWGGLAIEKSKPALATEATSPVKDSATNDSATPALIASAPMGPMLAEMEKRWGEGSVRFIYASGLGTPTASVGFGAGSAPEISTGGREWTRFNGITGQPLVEEKPVRGFFSKFHDVLYGLHLAHFAGPLLRVLFFFLGLLGSALVATGLVLWTAKRRDQKGFGIALVERLNIAVIAGFPLALATFFWTNRLLPVSFPERGDWEVNVVFIVWGLAFVHPWIRRPLQAWKEQLWIGAGLFLLLPLLDAVTSGQYLREAVTHGNKAYLGFLVTTFLTGLALAYAALKAKRKKKES